ncbi:hypothetical protein [Mesorhizobium sp.]|uniref:hypothetical protein n=1 Tax=Mesorhizobium sp. TaxID=1871066 RepID=UPI000FEA8BF4|nr:hypothetical protein [Mesorhizobium sp.]RWP09581.1 MAG: hypothetical protein EOQ97_16230 [Mesorhizobium sp.]
MISAVSATMTSAVVAIMRLVEPFATSNSLTARTFLWRGHNHAPKDKGNRAGKHQQQNSEMHPPSLGHPISHLFPRPGRQFNSTMWM